ncbi:MAG: peptide chain release factor N(5)-glutamine methyltransferase [Candidatus Krumholzibacteriota bacterium]|nr:peptide chain release factor N(5)-glutamine methyltransferase [Candidatus Krumholzibacteriota bacterium]
MYEPFQEIYQEFVKSGVPNPLEETLHLIDLLSGGAVRRAENLNLEELRIDVSDLLEKRKAGTPMEYILGMATFMGESLLCMPGALIPRQETELLTRICLDFIGLMKQPERDLNIVEMGTGCGNIAVSIALNTTQTRIFASDISAEAVAVAQKNVEKFNLNDRVKLFCGDLFAPLEGLELKNQVDLVVCNPPYIPTASLSKMDPSIIDNEPVVALDAGAYGIDIFRRLINDSLDYLRPGGVLAFEIGVGQDKLVTRLFKKKGGFADVNFYDDGVDIRVFSARKAKT